MQWLLPVLLCGGGMVLCMVLMNRMGGHGTNNSADTSDEVRALREEVAQLRADQAEPRAGHDG